MLRKLRQQLCAIADVHISKIKSWRNRFADQTKVIRAFKQSRGFSDSTRYVQLQLLACKNFAAHHQRLQ